MTVDLTGWTPHAGKGLPADLNDDEVVTVLLRGREETGPRESGPAIAMVLSWFHTPGNPQISLDPMMVVERRTVFAAGDIIAYRREGEESGTRYPHIRGDIR